MCKFHATTMFLLVNRSIPSTKGAELSEICYRTIFHDPEFYIANVTASLNTCHVGAESRKSKLTMMGWHQCSEFIFHTTFYENPIFALKVTR
jgi:hypothetical protein